MSALVGTTLAGKYLIKRAIGAGGMGAVYEGEHVEIGKRVAIKVIEPRFAASPEMATRFRREARAASAVESDHIVQVFDIGQDPSVGLYMVMEFLTGEDLAKRVETQKGPLPVPEAIDICAQVARALAKAHAAGVVHRDLKPANIYLTKREDGTTHAKILDFGISKLVRDDGGAKTTQKGLTREGAVIGTPQYMSPEQAQGQPVDLRTDVWSLGAVLYEALSGVSAYEEKDSYEMTIIHIVTTKARPLREIAPWVSPEIAAVVHAALTHDPRERLADCATFARRLAEAPASGNLPTAEASQRIVLRPETPNSARSDAEMVSETVRPATAAGVSVATGAREAPRRGRVGMALVAVAIAGAVIAAVAFGMRRAPPPAVGIAPPSAIAGDPPIATPPPLPLVATVPPPSSAPSAPPDPPASAAAIVVPTVRPTGRPRGAAPAAATPPPRGSAPPAGGPTQYGAAGVSTTY